MSDDSDMRGGVFILEGQSTDFNSNGVAVENIYLIDRDGNEVATFRPEDVYDYVSPMGQDHNGDDLVMIQYKKGVSTFEGGTKVYKIDHINKTLIPLEEYTVSQNHMTGRTYIDDAGTFRPALIYTISSGVRKNQLGLGSSPVSGVDQNQMMSYRDGSDTLQYKQLAAEALSAINDDDEQFSGTPNSNIAIYSHHDPGDNVGTLRNCHTGYLCRTGTGADDSPRPFYCFQANTNTTAVTYHSRSHVSRVMPSGAFVAVFRGVLDTGSNSHSFVKIFPALLNEADHDTVMGGSAPD
ncbi:hypothetical protein [uncultured Algoriphagus sp.]|uniref:hypothetical protein n=1 Tax=uncultured Algoriphagus sp. TaxID=417365 RepID=UPI002594FBC6|nr:hypothetical protein [uncultured Algoriphagus sp.]